MGSTAGEQLPPDTDAVRERTAELWSISARVVCPALCACVLSAVCICTYFHFSARTLGSSLPATFWGAPMLLYM